MENITVEISKIFFALGLMLGEYIMVLLAVAADLISGVRKARLRGEARRSRAFRRTIDKMARYYNALFALSVIDVMQMAGVAYVRVACGYDVPLLPCFTLLGAIGIALIEVKSIYEKAEDKEQRDIKEAATLLSHCITAFKDIDIKSIKNNKS